MGWSERLLPRSITAQITGLAAVSVLLGIALTMVILWLTVIPAARTDNPTLAAGRIIEITRLMRAASNPAEAEAFLAAARRGGLQVERIAIRDLVPTTNSETNPLARWPLRSPIWRLHVELLEGLRDPTGPRNQVITRLDQDHALVFGLTVQNSLWPIVLTPTALLVIIVVVSMLLLSIYAVRWVVAPLAAFADAATSFGRSSQPQAALTRRGPREIIKVADALNDMRTRIRGLLDDRTRMLAAISHDLRTPLTRLRLRTERVERDDLRTAMLDDLTKVSRMLDETLEYLRDDARSEPPLCIDLSSFLQTICSDFTDMGHVVSYQGPARLSCDCRPRALSRAVTNIVENAVKHAATVTVALQAGDSGRIEIEIADDGPGIPPHLRDKVFEPFFKADNARQPSNGGFGLGLSIAQDIIKRHGGTVEMWSRQPRGLRVLVALPSVLPQAA